MEGLGEGEGWLLKQTLELQRAKEAREGSGAGVCLSSG